MNEGSCNEDIGVKMLDGKEEMWGNLKVGKFFG